MITDLQMRQKPREGTIWLTERVGPKQGALQARITPSAARVFYYRYTDDERRQVRLIIGPYDPDGKKGLTLEQARKEAGRLAGLRKEHPDLREHLERQKQAEEEAERARLAELERQRLEAEEAARLEELERQRRITVRQLFERWADTELRARTGPNGKRLGRKDGGQYVREQFERHVFPAIGDMAVADVKRADLMAIFDAHVARGAARTAGMLFADLKQMLRFAVLRELIEYSPLSELRIDDIGGSRGEARERVLCATQGKPDELRLLAEKLPASRLNQRYAAAIWIMLATACRAGELLQARWEHVDLQRRIWRIPAEAAKNDREHLVHLSAFALRHFEALANLREVGPDGQALPWVFPSREGDGPVCIKTFGKQIADRQRGADGRLMHRSKATDALCLPGGRWTPHDLRRTAATILAELGFAHEVIDACLNHVIESRVTRTYIVSRRWDEQARAFDALGRKLDAIVTGEAMGDNVVPLPRKA